jgi:hypothetical protein
VPALAGAGARVCTRGGDLDRPARRVTLLLDLVIAIAIIGGSKLAADQHRGRVAVAASVTVLEDIRRIERELERERLRVVRALEGGRK